MSNPQQLVQKLWNYCNILRDDGLSYGDYVEQLPFLLLLKWRMSRRTRLVSRPAQRRDAAAILCGNPVWVRLLRRNFYFEVGPPLSNPLW
jgi:type I restriction enzyme M protein